MVLLHQPSRLLDPGFSPAQATLLDEIVQRARDPVRASIEDPGGELVAWLVSTRGPRRTLCTSYRSAAASPQAVKASKPLPKTRCGTRELVLRLHIEQTRASSPKGPKKLTPKMNQLSQSCPRGLPEQYPETGQTAVARHTTATTISIEAAIFCCAEI